MLLTHPIEDQTRWREIKVEVFPDDRRNGESVAALKSLGEFLESLEDDPDDGDFWMLDMIGEHLDNETGKLGGRQVLRELSRYGFGYGVSESSHREMLKDLWIACLEDAYDHAAANEDDPTGQLSRAELFAARSDLPLPENYWRRRTGGATEDELEAEIDGLVQAKIAEDE